MLINAKHNDDDDSRKNVTWNARLTSDFNDTFIMVLVVERELKKLKKNETSVIMLSKSFDFGISRTMLYGELCRITTKQSFAFFRGK